MIHESEPNHGSKPEPREIDAIISAQNQLMSGEMPSTERYADEVFRLANIALANRAENNLGYQPSFKTVVLFRGTPIYTKNANHFQVRDFRNIEDDITQKPLMIQIVTLLPSPGLIDSKLIVPVESRTYTPADDKLRIARLDHLTLDVARSHKMEELLRQEMEFNPIEATMNDRFAFYGDLVQAAGETLIGAEGSR